MIRHKVQDMFFQRCLPLYNEDAGKKLGSLCKGYNQWLTVNQTTGY
jgi:hypothetical protein